MGRTLGPIASEDDPLALALAPPEDESPQQRAMRLQNEAIAKKISDDIDSQLQAERLSLRKKQRTVKVLLLGQSESGKSTTLKNFQLTYASKAWAAEKDAWRAVIQLNLVRSVNAIADAVAAELERASSLSNTGSLASPTALDADAFLDTSLEADDVDGASVLSVPTSPAPAPVFPLTDHHRELLPQLTVLRAVQRDLERRLGSGAEEDLGQLDGGGRSQSAPPSSYSSDYPGHAAAAGNGAGAGGLRVRKSQEFFVRSNGWKNALQRFRPRLSISARPGTGTADGADGADAATVAIAGARGAMQALWEDRVVREVVRVRQVRLIDSAEFFLGDIGRVADVRYTPSDDDVIRARLRTVGVQEHHITPETGPEAGREWLIYDVGGSRSMRAQWPSYFDDVNAIIFLAPINCFDERLAEDVRVNRLDDSLQLWKLVCSNKLLARTELVLFLNKCDLLEKKLRGGVRFADYVASFGTRENEAAAVGKYLKGKFNDVCRQYSKEHRGLHVHFTSVIDTKATAKTLAAVQDGILRTHLRQLDLI